METAAIAEPLSGDKLLGLEGRCCFSALTVLSFRHAKTTTY